MVCFLCMPTAAPVQSGGMTVQIYHFLCSGTTWAKCQNVKSGCPRIRYFRPGEGGGENNGFSCGVFLSFCNERRSCTVLLSAVPEVCAYVFTVGKAASLFRCHSVFCILSVHQTIPCFHLLIHLIQAVCKGRLWHIILHVCHALQPFRTPLQ